MLTLGVYRACLRSEWFCMRHSLAVLVVLRRLSDRGVSDPGASNTSTVLYSEKLMYTKDEILPWTRLLFSAREARHTTSPRKPRACNPTPSLRTSVITITHSIQDMLVQHHLLYPPTLFSLLDLAVSWKPFFAHYCLWELLSCAIASAFCSAVD